MQAGHKDVIVAVQEGCREPHGLLCRWVGGINKHHQQTLQQHNSKQDQAAAELKAALAQQQSLQQQLHAFYQDHRRLQQLAAAVAIAGLQQLVVVATVATAEQRPQDLDDAVHLTAQQKEQLDVALQELADARRINMQQGHRLAHHQQHNSQLQQQCNDYHATTQHQARQLEHLQQQHQAMVLMNCDLQQQLVRKDALLAQQQRELDQLRQCTRGLRLAQQQQQRTHYLMETMGGFQPVYSWQCTSQQPPVAHQGQQEVQQQQQQRWHPFGRALMKY